MVKQLILRGRRIELHSANKDSPPIMVSPEMELDVWGVVTWSLRRHLRPLIPAMFGLVDGNNFYASVERVFDPRLRGKPVIVLSNNDGCAIARSNEAKALGIKMGQPVHEVPPQVRRQCIVRSANFALYGDMSGRIVTILRDLFPRVEVYSTARVSCLTKALQTRLASAYRAGASPHSPVDRHSLLHRHRAHQNALEAGQQAGEKDRSRRRGS